MLLVACYMDCQRVVCDCPIVTNKVSFCRKLHALLHDEISQLWRYLSYNSNEILRYLPSTIFCEICTRGGRLWYFRSLIFLTASSALGGKRKVSEDMAIIRCASKTVYLNFTLSNTEYLSNREYFDFGVKCFSLEILNLNIVCFSLNDTALNDICINVYRMCSKTKLL